ncbi:unnamed protein product [Durusdinium trenchii]|uniref:THUMP domain-containing protein n=1 Tax=Durusdinium trenchii TaxID=1381693 RepID=A0ABP0NP70_9DINO
MAKRLRDLKEASKASDDVERGFLVTGPTCQEALRGLKDLRLHLEVEAEERKDTQSDHRNSEGVSVCHSLDVELAELHSQRRFLTVGMVCKQVAFLRAQHVDDIPSRLLSRFLVPGRDRFVSRFADRAQLRCDALWAEGSVQRWNAPLPTTSMQSGRVLPVDMSSQPRSERFSRLAQDVLASHAGRPWRLLYEPFRGGWNTISKEDAFEVCRNILGADRQSVADPEITVVCTVQPRFVGLAVVTFDVDYLRVEDEIG